MINGVMAASRLGYKTCSVTGTLSPPTLLPPGAAPPAPRQSETVNNLNYFLHFGKYTRNSHSFPRPTENINLVGFLFFCIFLLLLLLKNG